MTAAQLIFLVLLFGSVSLAFWQGGRDERLAAGALVAATVITPIVHFRVYASPEVGIMIVDFGLFLVLAYIALRSQAFWPMWAAGFQLGSLAVHVAAAQMSRMLPAAYAETLAIWAFPVVIAVGLGSWLESGVRHGRS